MDKEIYCGANPLKPNQRHGTLNECVEANQVRLYGINQVPEHIISMIKAGMRSSIQVNNRLKKLYVELSMLNGAYARLAKMSPKKFGEAQTPEDLAYIKKGLEAKEKIPQVKKAIEELKTLKQSLDKSISKVQEVEKELILPPPKVSKDNTKIMEDILKMGLDFEKKLDTEQPDRKVMRPIKMILERHTVSELKKYMDSNRIRYNETDNKDDLINRIIRRQAKPNFNFIRSNMNFFFKKHSTVPELHKFMDKHKIDYDKTDTREDLIEKIIYKFM